MTHYEAYVQLTDQDGKVQRHLEHIVFHMSEESPCPSGMRSGS